MNDEGVAMKAIVLITTVVILLTGVSAEEIVINPAKVVVRKAPNFLSETVSTVVKGDKLTKVGQKGEWLEVKTSTGISGWVAKRALIPPSSNLLKMGSPDQMTELSSAELTASIRGVLEVSSKCSGKLPKVILSKIESDFGFVFGVKQQRSISLTQFKVLRKLTPGEPLSGSIENPLGLDREMEIAQATLVSLFSKNKISRDSRLYIYLDSIISYLGGFSERSDLPYYPIVLDSPTINSFSIPGGFIFITTGLLRAIGDESVLAAVLAHEMVHIARYHGLSEMGRKEVQTKGYAGRAESDLDRELAGLGADKQLKSGAAKDIAKDACEMSTMVNKWTSKGRAQSDEYEADRIALVYLHRAGYDTNGLISFLTLVAARGKAEGDVFAAHHPPHNQRIEKMKTYIKEEGLTGKVDRSTFKTQYRVNVRL